MSRQTFNDECPGCKPILIDPSTHKPYPDNHPMMIVLGRVWQETTREQREAYHRVCCNNSETPEDVAVATEIAEIFRQEIIKNLKNPYTKPGCLKVSEVFKARGQVCPFFIGGPFATVEDMMATFDKPEELFVVRYAPNSLAVARIIDKDIIERKRILTDQLIAKTGKEYGQLTMQDVTWVKEQLDRIMVESN